MSTGQRIRELRKLSGITQEELAYKLKISKKTIYRIENGESCPVIDTLKDVASILCINIDYLMNESDEKYFISKRMGVRHPFEGLEALYPYFVQFCNNKIQEDEKYYLISLYNIDEDNDAYICGGATRYGGVKGEFNEYEIRLLRLVNGNGIKNYLDLHNYKYMIVNNNIDALLFYIYNGLAIIKEKCLEVNFPWYIDELYTQRGLLDAQGVDCVISNFCTTKFCGLNLPKLYAN